MLILLLVHLVAGAVLLGGARYRPLHRFAFALASLPLVLELVLMVSVFDQVTGGEPKVERLEWVPGLDLGIDLGLDGLGLLMTLLVAGIGLAVMVFSSAYFDPGPDPTRTAGLLVLFAGAMLGLVQADHVIAIFVFWELTSITSWLLIGQRHESAAARSAASHALLVTGAGGLSLLAGLVLLAQEAGTWSLAGILAAAPGGAEVVVATGLIVIAIMTKSAQFPTHAWLPGAMVAPTPVSAYLHSATMVKAGIYFAARIGPVFVIGGGWRPVVIGVGLVTMIWGGVRALWQTDLKLLLATGTISQLGFLMVLAASGGSDATKAALVLLVAHALFKATLFLVVGAVDKQTGTRILGQIPVLGEGWRSLRLCALVSAASMAGLPPLLGFVAKESAFESFAHGDPGEFVALAGLVAGSILTVAYSIRFGMVFLRRDRGSEMAEPAAGSPSLGLRAPVWFLTAFTVGAAGLPGGPLQRLLGRTASELISADAEVGLALWHGFSLPLYSSIVAVASGFLLHRHLEGFVAVAGRARPRLDGQEVFGRSVDALNRGARVITGHIQTGSLPTYAAIILVVVIVAPSAVLLASGEVESIAALDAGPMAMLLAFGIAMSAVAATLVRRRFAAIVLLGAVGYAMAGLFVVQGAPDLALTQFAVETLAIVAFMLVLRLLPRSFRARSRSSRSPARLIVPLLVASGVFVFAIATSELDRPTPAADLAVAQAKTEAGGANIVNVVLVDFRGLDTLGEITVLTVAAVGVTALARAGRRRTDVPTDHRADTVSGA